MKDLIQRIRDNEKLNEDLSPNWGLIGTAVSIFFVVVIIYLFAAQTVGGTRIEVLGAGLQLMITVALAFVLVDFTFHKTNEKRFIHALGNLVQEMIDNTTKLTDEAFNTQLKDFPEKIQKKLNGEKQWIGFGKSPSFTNWNSNYGNFFLKYLPTTNYYYFINQGFFNAKISSKIEEGSKSHIATVFDAYSKINVKIQQCENIFQNTERIEAVDFQQTYFWIRNSAFEDWDCKKFMKDSVSIIEKLNELYPEIKKKEKIAKLREQLKDDLDDQQSTKTDGRKTKGRLWSMTWKGYTGYELFRLALGIGLLGYAVFSGLVALSVEDLQWKLVFLSLGFTIFGIGFMLYSSVKTDRDMEELKKKIVWCSQ
jgi:hypothetical protein